MKYLARAYPWLLAAPVVLPVVVWSGVIYPFLLPKTLLFYTLTLLSLAAFLLLAARGTPLYLARVTRPASLIPLALLALAYLASALGIDFYRSFWSLFVRGDGLLMLTGAVGSFYLILLTADRDFFFRLSRAAAVVGTLVALYGIGEWFINGGRVGSLLGNAAFFAGYLGIAFFATLIAGEGVPLFWRRAAYAAAFLEVVAIVLSATRGTILALGASALIALSYFAWRGQGFARRASATLLLALALLGGVFVAFRAELSRVPFEPVARIANVSFSENDVASRLFIWQHMLGEITARPFFGVGAEHIDYLFNSFYDPTQIVEEWFDRSHNAFLDYAAEYGVGGLLLYLALIGSFFAAARRFRAKGERRVAFFLALLATTYAAQNFFVFDTVSSFWLVLALLAASLAATDDSNAGALPLPSYARFLSWPLAAALLLAIIPVSVRPFMAAYDLAHAFAFAVVDPSRSASYLSNGYALHTYGNLEYGYEAYDMFVNHQLTTLSGDALTGAYHEAVQILSDDFDRYPYDGRTALYLAHVLSSAPAGTSPDTDLLARALARAIERSPSRYQPWYILANLSIDTANAYPAGSAGRARGYRAALDLMERYVARVPRLSEPHFVLADLRYALSDAQDARAEAALGKRYYRGDLSTAKRAALYYETVHDLPAAAFFLAEVYRLDPTAYALIYDLAKIEYLEDDKAAALRVVDYLRAHDPSRIGTDPNFAHAIAAYEASLP